MTRSGAAVVEEGRRTDREALVLCRFRDLDLFGVRSVRRSVGGWVSGCVRARVRGRGTGGKNVWL